MLRPLFRLWVFFGVLVASPTLMGLSLGSLKLVDMLSTEVSLEPMFNLRPSARHWFTVSDGRRYEYFFTPGWGRNQDTLVVLLHGASPFDSINKRNLVLQSYPNRNRRVLLAGFAVLFPVYPSTVNISGIVYPVGDSGFEPPFHKGDPSPAVLFLDELVSHVRSRLPYIRHVFLGGFSGGSIFAWTLLLEALRREVPPFFSAAAMMSGYWYRRETFEVLERLHHEPAVAVFSVHSRLDEYLPYNGQLMCRGSSSFGCLLDFTIFNASLSMTNLCCQVYNRTLTCHVRYMIFSNCSFLIIHY
jgi:poly(3-hydroxybutyrate) depolymerase